MEIEVSNCKSCHKVYRISNLQQRELCHECLVINEAQYKVAIRQIEKLLFKLAPIHTPKDVDALPRRVQIYLSHRFNYPTSKGTTLEGHRRGYCYLCNLGIYYPLEAICLTCLHSLPEMLVNSGKQPEAQENQSKAFPKPKQPLMPSQFLLTPSDNMDSLPSSLFDPTYKEGSNCL